jgi:hypothetical protein
VKRKPWRQTTTRLASAEVAVFTGPGPEYTIVIHGVRKPPRPAKRTRT